MRTLVLISTVAWGFLLLSNGLVLGLAVFANKSPNWTFVAILFALTIAAIAAPWWLRARKGPAEGTWTAGTLLLLWIPLMIYCLQFWSPDQGG